MDNHSASIQRQFGSTAQAYVHSPIHRQGRDLDILLGWCEGGPQKSALDVATGGGHTALRLASVYGHVTATDLTQQMLDSAEAWTRECGVTNVHFRRADAEHLPFAAESFDAVSCRIAPHHFRRPDIFVAEVSRVLKPNGILLLEDTVAPDDGEVAKLFNHVEWLRDPTHVRNLTRGEWKSLIEGAGLVIEEEDTDRKEHDIEEWLRRSETPAERRETVRRALVEASEAARAQLRIDLDAQGRPLSFTDDKLLVKARRAAS